MAKISISASLYTYLNKCDLAPIEEAAQPVVGVKTKLMEQFGKKATEALTPVAAAPLLNSCTS